VTLPTTGRLRLPVAPPAERTDWIPMPHEVEQLYYPVLPSRPSAAPRLWRTGEAHRALKDIIKDRCREELLLVHE